MKPKLALAMLNALLIVGLAASSITLAPSAALAGDDNGSGTGGGSGETGDDGTGGGSGTTDTGSGN